MQQIPKIYASSLLCAVSCALPLFACGLLVQEFAGIPTGLTAAVRDVSNRARTRKSTLHLRMNHRASPTKQDLRVQIPRTSNHTRRSDIGTHLELHECNNNVVTSDSAEESYNARAPEQTKPHCVPTGTAMRAQLIRSGRSPKRGTPRAGWLSSLKSEMLLPLVWSMDDVLRKKEAFH